MQERLLQKKMVQQSLESNVTEMTETSGNVMGISQYHKRKQNMTQLGNMVWTENSQDKVKSSIQEVTQPVMVAEETTELRDVATREPKEVKIYRGTK